MPVILPRWMKRTLVGGAAAMVVLGAFGLLNLGLKADWLAFYAAGRFALEGRLAQLYNLPALQAWQAKLIGDAIAPFLYPPAYGLVLAPLALLPPWTARLAWLGIGLAAAFSAAGLSARWSGLSRAWSCVALVAFPPLAYSLAVGQASPITLLIFTGVAALEWRGQRGMLPGLLAGLALYKPQLLLPLAVYWLAAGRPGQARTGWRSLAGLAMMGMGVLLLSLLAESQSLAAYWRLSQEFFGLAGQSTATGANAALFAVSPYLGAAVGLLALIALALVARQQPNRWMHAMLWLAPVLVTPYIVVYDLLLPALAISFLIPLLLGESALPEGRALSRWGRLLLQAAVGLVWVTPLLAIPLQSTRPITWSVLGLFIVCAWQAWATRPTSLQPGVGGDQDQVSQQDEQTVG